MERLLLFSNTEIILTGLLTGLFIIQLLYSLITYAHPWREARKAKPKEAKEHPPVSLIVYARNESVNLKNHLLPLLTQNYPEYEVIVINDGSTDESDEVLKTFENEYKHLYHTYIPEDVKYLSRKKLALTIGIKAAKHDILLFTEANCQPLSENWIASMARNYTSETTIVLGFCAYGYHQGFLHKLISYDNLLNGLQYITSALSQHPYTGNGRNLSYRKELFFQHKGFYKSLNLHAGDDDLFINESATKSNTRLEYTPESITEMTKIEQFKVWKEMKASRAATQHYYKGWNQMFFRLESASLLLFLLAMIASICTGIYGNWLVTAFALLLYALRFTAKAVVLHKSACMLRQNPATSWLPILELMQPLFNIYIHIYRIFRGKNDYTFRLNK